MKSLQNSAGGVTYNHLNEIFLAQDGQISYLYTWAWRERWFVDSSRGV